MALDKKAVFDEALEQLKVQRYLEMQPEQGENGDFHVLLKAYRGLPANAFEAFVELFIAAGRNINAVGAEGKTFLASISSNIAHLEYQEVLRRHGAR